MAEMVAGPAPCADGEAVNGRRLELERAVFCGFQIQLDGLPDIPQRFLLRVPFADAAW